MKLRSAQRQTPLSVRYIVYCYPRAQAAPSDDGSGTVKPSSMTGNERSRWLKSRKTEDAAPGLVMETDDGRMVTARVGSVVLHFRLAEVAV